MTMTHRLTLALDVSQNGPRKMLCFLLVSLSFEPTKGAAILKKTNFLSAQVQIAEHKVKKVLVGATSFLIVFNSLAAPRLRKKRCRKGSLYFPFQLS